MRFYEIHEIINSLIFSKLYYCSPIWASVMAFKYINGFAPPYLQYVRSFVKDTSLVGAVQDNQTILRHQNAELQQDRDHSTTVPSTYGTLVVPLSNNLCPLIILNTVRRNKFLSVF